MKKRYMSAILVVLILVSLISGCEKTSSNESFSEQEEAIAPSELVPEIEEEADLLEEHTADNGLPISEELATFTMWNGAFSASAFVEDPNETVLHQKMEELTNVKVILTYAAQESVNEKLNLMYASGDMTDLIMSADGQYAGGLGKAVSDDIYVDLTDMIEEFAPNYSRIRNEDQAVFRDTMTDDGMIPVLYQITDTAQWTWYGPIVRKDLLDANGLDIPVTFDDWEKMLTAFKDGGMSAPLNPCTFSNKTGVCLIEGYGISDAWFQKDGTAIYGPADDTYRDYLTMMHRWYENGLISSDLVSNSMVTLENDVLNSETGAFQHAYTIIDNYNKNCKDENAEFIGVTMPVLTAGDTVHLGNFESRTKTTYVAISTCCNDVELALRYIDYFFSPEGSLLASYGVEGVTYTINEAGDPQFTDMITAPENGGMPQQAMYGYLDGNPQAYLYIWERELQFVGEGALACEDVWKHDGAYIYPAKVAMTDEESAEVSGVMADIETYVSECTLQFIVGDMSLDEFDSYLSKLNELGLSDAAIVKQAALDRYMVR